MAGHGPARQGRQGRQAWRGGARPGEARPGRAGQARLGRARRGKAGRGRAGEARQGEAGQGKAGKARHGKARQARKTIHTIGGLIMEYSWKDGARKGGMDAQKVGERLEKLRRRDGVLTPGAVVMEAQKKSSPLHEGFEWDDMIAASLYREERARDITRSITVTVRGADAEPVVVRAFVHLQDAGDYEYEDIHTILTNPQKRDSLLKEALAMLRLQWSRYKMVQELSGVWAALDEVAK